MVASALIGRPTWVLLLPRPAAMCLPSSHSTVGAELAPYFQHLGCTHMRGVFQLCVYYIDKDRQKQKWMQYRMSRVFHNFLMKFSRTRWTEASITDFNEIVEQNIHSFHSLGICSCKVISTCTAIKVQYIKREQFFFSPQESGIDWLTVQYKGVEMCHTIVEKLQRSKLSTEKTAFYFLVVL